MRYYQVNWSRSGTYYMRSAWSGKDRRNGESRKTESPSAGFRREGTHVPVGGWDYNYIRMAVERMRELWEV